MIDRLYMVFAVTKDKKGNPQEKLAAILNADNEDDHPLPSISLHKEVAECMKKDLEEECPEHKFRVAEFIRSN